METKEILKDIINRIRNNKDLEEISELRNDSDLRNDLGFDSLDLAELTVRIEHKFGIDVFADGLVSTVGEIIDKINKKNV